MQTCIKSLAEQVIFQVRGGDPSAGSSIEEPEVRIYLAQLINQRIKASYFSETMVAGERIPDGLVIGTYTELPVEAYKNLYSRVELPFMPVSLPMSMGVYGVRGSDDVFGLAQFIICPRGTLAMLTKESLISDVLGQVACEPMVLDGKPYMVFNKDITATAPQVTSVDLDLVGLDPAKVGDYDLLPVSADIAAAVVMDAVKFFSAQMPSDKLVDSSSDNQNK